MKYMRVVWVVLLGMGLVGCGSQQFKESFRVSVDTVEAQVLVATPETSAVRVGVSIAGEFGDPCVELRSVRQVREGNTFKLTLEAVERVDVFCPPVGVFFREFVLLEAQTLTAGSYGVEAGALNTVTASFELQEGATYREADVAEVEVMPTASFEANVIARGTLSGCEVIDGALQRQEGTDRDMLPDDVFTISLISRIAESCGVESGSFEEVIPIQAYGSGDYTVGVNGVTRSFTLP